MYHWGNLSSLSLFPPSFSITQHHLCVCACIQSSSRANGCIVPAERWVLESETETLEWRQETSLRLVLMHGRRPKLVSMVENTAGFWWGPAKWVIWIVCDLLKWFKPHHHLPKDICLLSWKFVCKYRHIQQLHLTAGFSLIHTLVVGLSSFSATQPCRLNNRSWQLTRTLFPNFSSNCCTLGSMAEKSSFCGNKSCCQKA